MVVDDLASTVVALCHDDAFLPQSGSPAVRSLAGIASNFCTVHARVHARNTRLRKRVNAPHNRKTF